MHDNATLIRLLRQLTVETDRFAELFGEAHRMHRTDLNALTLIMDAKAQGRPLSPTGLARALHLSASATTSVLDRLESSGHIRRVRSATDRRKVELVVADQALELGRAFFVPLGLALTEAWTGFDDEQRATITRFLQASVEATAAVRATLVEPDQEHSPADRV
ncbi:MarR family winged helix-turn-helix transcriptional regulator [Saccharothrix coeruleofusca]|uniref:Transcriptional regulator n=1 Tax=Saccharothrix coeruleofusca TaxID=33919 RepID=A0A918APB7_9PSEU|nr:MarR family transcriptional regulator [Saccharothrix coeruleofusca]MBP2337581.1 DNA-binding MarR family transcriptional regulator [Saccharothrix coeruleofusca]GGP64830.1 transcriptional regulator [Saccharothrix coeruleofusca]